MYIYITYAYCPKICPKGQTKPAWRFAYWQDELYVECPDVGVDGFEHPQMCIYSIDTQVQSAVNAGKGGISVTQRFPFPP